MQVTRIAGIEPPAKGQHVVYGIFGQWSDLLYVGVTSDFPSRMRAHERTKSWWPDVDWIGWRHYETRAEAEAAELLSIEDENPRYNRARLNRWVDDFSAALGDARYLALRESALADEVV